MSDLQSWLGTIAQLGIAAGVVYGIIQNVTTKRAVTAAAAASAATEKKIDVVAADVRKVELASNSMKDALVAATARASHLEGRAEQRAEAASEKA